MVTVEVSDDSHARSGREGWRPSRPVLVLVGARAVNQLGAFSLPFLAVLLVQRFGASTAAAGLVVALFGVATIPSRLAGGWLVGRLGARATVALGLVACAVAQLAIAVSPTLVAALVAATALGLAYEIYEPGSQSLVAALTPAGERSRAFGLFGAALAAGGVVGGLLAAVLGGLDLRWLFVADAGSCLGAALVVRLGLPDHRTADLVPDGEDSGSGGRARPWRDPRLLAMVAVGTGFATLYLQLRVALPLTLVDRGVPASRFGLVLALSSLTVVVAQPLLGLRVRHRRPVRPLSAMALGFLALGVGMGATGLVTSLTGFLVATLLWAVGDVLLLGHPMAVVADLAPPGGSAAYLAAYGCCWGVAGILAPLAGGAVLDRAGPTTLWLGSAAIGTALAVVTQVLSRRWPDAAGPGRAADVAPGA